MTWEGTPADPGSPTWAEYQTDREGPIPEAEWPRYRAEAHDILRGVTFGESETQTDADILAAIDKAVYRTADALYAADTGVVSERIGSYSFSRAGVTMTRADAVSVAVKALSGTGLTYRGL